MIVSLACDGRAGAEEFQDDPHICVSPVRSGDPEEPFYATLRSSDRPEFIPGHPTPIFTGNFGSSYLDADDRLRRHPVGGPSTLTSFYRGSDGDVYYWAGSGEEGRRFVFDPSLGYFRRIGLAEPDRQAEVDGLIAESRAADRPDNVPSHTYLNSSRPPIRAQVVDGESDRQGRGVPSRAIAEVPDFGLRAEGEGNTLHLTRGGRSRDVEIAGIGNGNWSLTAIEKSGRVLLMKGWSLLLIDENLRLTRPAGDWRLRLPEVIYLPESGEALVTTVAAGIGGRGLFWMRDRRISGSDICGDTTAPPEQAWRLVQPAGADKMDLAHLNMDVEPAWIGGVFMIGARNGAFALSLDGEVRRMEDLPVAFTTITRVPGSDIALVDSCDRFFLHDGGKILYASGDLTGWFESGCVHGLTPVSFDPTSGAIRLSRGWTLTGDGRLDRSGGAFDTGISWWDWLEVAPNPAFLPGGEWSPDGRTVDRSLQDFWWKLPRFGFAIRQDPKGRFVRIGPDRVEITDPDQPENPNHSLDGIGLVFDPGRGDILAVDVSDRVMRISPDGDVRPVDCARPCPLRGITSMDADPGNPDGTLIGSTEGLFRYAPGEVFKRVLPVGLTGAVGDIQTLPSIGEVLIEAAFGRFVWSEEAGARRIGFSGVPRNPMRLFTFPGSDALFTQSRIPLRFELIDALDP